MTRSGSDVTPGGTPIRSDPTLDPARADTPAAEEEKVYFEGSPLVRGHLSQLFIFGLIGALLIAIPFLWRYWQETWPFGTMWSAFIFILAGLIFWVIPVLAAKTIRYRISSYRIDFERGLLGKKIDTMELWHVDDIKFNQSFLDRMLGVGTITIMSDDQTTPELNLRGVPNPRPLFETLKNRVITIKRSRGFIKMDTGT